MSNQFNQPTPPHIPPEIPIGSISPDLLAMAGQMRRNPISKPMTHAVSGASMSMSDALSGVSNAWTMPSVAAQTMTNFGQPFTPMPSSGPSQSGTRQVSPSSLYAIDGSDWYLKDGVSWQQNFEAWNLGAGGGANGGAGMADGSMFMFRGLRGSDIDSGAFDSLNMSAGSLDQLPGLD
jgi:hypothetical protein